MNGVQEKQVCYKNYLIYWIAHQKRWTYSDFGVKNIFKLKFMSIHNLKSFVLLFLGIFSTFKWKSSCVGLGVVSTTTKEKRANFSSYRRTEETRNKWKMLVRLVSMMWNAGCIKIKRKVVTKRMCILLENFSLENFQESGFMYHQFI